MKSSQRRWPRSAARAVVFGAVAALMVASVASAVDTEPTEHDEQGPYPDQPGYDDPPGPFDNDSSSTGQDDCSASADGPQGTDIIKLTGPGIDFGDNTWTGRGPIGVGSVRWSVTCGFFAARLVGTLHLDGESVGFGRMHVSYWTGGERIAIRHGGTVRAPDDDHQPFSVDISSPVGVHATEVIVCTELSSDGVDFEQVDCKTLEM